MASKKNEGSSCGPCFLCKKSSTQYMHGNKFTDEEYRLVSAIEGEEIDKDKCICHACYKQIKCNVHNENFQPRWEAKLQTIPKCKCHIIDCEEDVYQNTDLATPKEIESIVGSAICSPQDSGERAGLCHKHYTLVYEMLHPPNLCASCGAKPTKEDKISRHCPNTEIINDYLFTISNEISTITDKSYICYACYKLFLSIVKIEKASAQTITVLPSLYEVMTEIKAKIVTIDSIYDNEHSITLAQFQQLVVMKVALNCAEVMNNDEALLLPSVYSSFKDKYCTMSSTFPFF